MYEKKSESTANLVCEIYYWLAFLGNGENSFSMAEALRIKVKCHACSNLIEGTAKYGSGHYVPTGVDFEFVAVAKVETSKGKTVKAEVTCVCPSCGVKCKFAL